MTGRIRRTFALSTLAAIVFATGAVHAQTSEKDADAERLFREGQKLMEQKRLGEACPKFEAAYRKDQQLGTLLNLAYCHKQQGAIWQAWLEFKEAEVKAVSLGRKDRRDFAKQRMTELEKTLAKVVIDATSKVELTEILVEDRRVFDGEKSVPFAVEVGPERKITFLAKGKRPAIQLVSVATQRKGEGPLHITVPEMEDEPPPAPVVVETPAAKPEPAPAKAVAVDNHAGAWRTAMFVTLGVGVPVLAAGAVLGVVTLGSKCTTSNRPIQGCNATDRANASTVAALSTVGVIAGAALTATGLGILLFGPKPAKKTRESRLELTPDLGPGWAGVHGSF